MAQRGKIQKIKDRKKHFDENDATFDIIFKYMSCCACVEFIYVYIYS
jgi:hypothetical protein